MAITLALLVPTVIFVNLRFPRWRPVLDVVSLLPLGVPAVVIVLGVLGAYRSLPNCAHGNPGDPGVGLRDLRHALLVPGHRRRRAVDRPAHCWWTPAGPWAPAGANCFTRLLLPNLRSGILAAAFLTVALSLGEYRHCQHHGLQYFPGLAGWSGGQQPLCSGGTIDRGVGRHLVTARGPLPGRFGQAKRRHRRLRYRARRTGPRDARWRRWRRQKNRPRRWREAGGGPNDHVTVNHDGWQPAMPPPAEGLGSNSSTAGARSARCMRWTDSPSRSRPASSWPYSGPSGCGKTTALRAVAGLEQLDEGRVLVGRGRHHPRAASSTQRRDGLPGLQPLPQYERFGKRGLRSGGPHASPPPATAQASRRTARAGRAWPVWRKGTRTSSPEDSNSGSRWPGRCASSPGCCCWTSRCLPSTPRSAPSSATRYAGSSWKSGSRRCS